MRKKYKKGGSDINNQSVVPGGATPQVKVNDGPPQKVSSPPPNPSPGEAPQLGEAPQPGKALQPGKAPQSGEKPSSESDSSMFSGLFTTLDEYKVEIGIGALGVTLLIIIAIFGYNKYKESTENEEIAETEESSGGGTSGGSSGGGTSGGSSGGGTSGGGTSGGGTSGGGTSGNSASSTSEGFVNYIEDYVNSIFEPGRPDINKNDKNKLLPGFIL